MQRLLNKTSLHFILSFTVVILIVLVLTLIATGYIGDDDVVRKQVCPPGEVC